MLLQGCVTPVFDHEKCQSKVSLGANEQGRTLALGNSPGGSGSRAQQEERETQPTELPGQPRGMAQAIQPCQLRQPHRQVRWHCRYLALWGLLFFK